MGFGSEVTINWEELTQGQFALSFLQSFIFALNFRFFMRSTLINFLPAESNPRYDSVPGLSWTSLSVVPFTVSLLFYELLLDLTLTMFISVANVRVDSSTASSLITFSHTRQHTPWLPIIPNKKNKSVRIAPPLVKGRQALLVRKSSQMKNKDRPHLALIWANQILQLHFLSPCGLTVRCGGSLCFTGTVNHAWFSHTSLTHRGGEPKHFHLSARLTMESETQRMWKLILCLN